MRNRMAVVPASRVDRRSADPRPAGVGHRAGSRCRPMAVVLRALRQRGASAVELVVALPVLLLFGLAIVQFGLVYQAQAAIDHAAMTAARRASVAHADMQAARRGLAQGLAPWWRGASDALSLQIAEAETLAHLEAGLAGSWVELVRRSPSDASFNDWAVPALDAFGDPIDGVVEIPNDNLDTRRVRMQPTGGTAGTREGEPVGAGSGQTLADANRLQLEFVYGLRLVVPVAGAAIVGALRTAQGCTGGADGTGGIGAQGAQGAQGGQGGQGISTRPADSTRGFCDYLMANPPRLPIRVTASVRMMSTARTAVAGGATGGATGGGMSSTESGATRAAGATGASGMSDESDASGSGRQGNGSGGVREPVGSVTDIATGADSAGRGASDVAAPRTATRGGESSLSNGFLQIGSDRPYPAIHPALCTR